MSSLVRVPLVRCFRLLSTLRCTILSDADQSRFEILFRRSLRARTPKIRPRRAQQILTSVKTEPIRPNRPDARLSRKREVLFSSEPDRLPTASQKVALGVRLYGHTRAGGPRSTWPASSCACPGARYKYPMSRNSAGYRPQTSESALRPSFGWPEGRCRGFPA